jgi:HEPN domain-containing protein
MRMNDRSLDWLRQAENDLGWARDTYKDKRWSQVCFIAQQVGEKALKALAQKCGAAQVRTHSIVDIAKSLGLNGDLERAGRRLDQYYMTTRYPDSLPAGAPFEFFDEEQAGEAIEHAAYILAFVRSAWER